MDRLLRNFALICVVFGLVGCSSVGYFWQAAAGHVSIMAQSRDIEEVLADPESPPWLVDQLVQVRKIRDYSVSELSLPDNRSYRMYSDIERKFPVWNVVAAPDDSLTLNTWCFPIVGCIAYKGFYAEEDALELAQELRDEGLDVAVSGVPAYSTLGFTADPILSSFVTYPPGELARLIFHELSHQVVYIENDTQFNESFATAVEQLGVQAWLGQVGHETLKQDYERFNDRREGFRRLLLEAKSELAAAYENEGFSREEKLSAKRVILEKLKVRYEQMKMSQWEGWGGYDAYFVTDLNNAKLALVGVYNQYVPAFKVLFARCGANFPKFYESVRALGKLPASERVAMLNLLENREPLPYALGCDQGMYVPPDGPDTSKEQISNIQGTNPAL
ncbi:MAG: aminopeptidase [Limnobacter sp.]|nr:aminopeptidase [Limnobacter sp.]